MKEPLVTVYMPTHNRHHLMVRAIKSICEQDYKNLQIIVCDDGSSDETWSVLQLLIQNDPRIVALKNVQPMGACFSRNRCIELAEGEFITGIDDDDEFLSNRISTFVSYAINHNYDLLSANLYYKYKTHLFLGENFEGIVTNKNIGYRNIIGNQMFVKTSLLKEIGGFDINAPAWQDYDLWFRLIHRYGGCYRLNMPTYTMDVSHDAPRITTSSKAYNGYIYFIRKHIDSLNRWQLNSLYLEDKTNRGEEIRFFDILTHICWEGVKSYIKNRIKESLPFVRTIINKKKLKNH